MKAGSRSCWLAITRSFVTRRKPHIEVLELPREFTPAEVKEAYYKLSKRYHPDSATANPDQFLLIKEAYEALKDGHKEGPACSMSLTTDDKDKIKERFHNYYRHRTRSYKVESKKDEKIQYEGIVVEEMSLKQMAINYFNERSVFFWIGWLFAFLVTSCTSYYWSLKWKEREAYLLANPHLRFD